MDPRRDLVSASAALLQHNRLDEAIRLAEECLQENQEDGEVWQILGILRHRARDMKAAQVALETASLLIPLDPSARCALAECYARNGHRELAVDLYTALPQDPRVPMELLGAAAAGLGSLGQNDCALEVCRELVRREPECHEGHFGIAFYLRRLGASVASALPFALRAHELAPQIPLYTVTLASMYFHSGAREEARDLLRDFDASTITCRCCLRRITAILHHGISPTDALESEGNSNFESERQDHEHAP